MRNITFFLIITLIFTYETSAQTAAEILSKYTERTGGQQKWDQVQSIEVNGRVEIIAQKMDLPFKRILLNDGRQITNLIINGLDYVDIAFDGNIAWGSNSAMQFEQKGKDAIDKVRRSRLDFPYPGYNWQERGFQADFLGEADVKGTTTFKVAITNKQQTADTISAADRVLYYFDVKTFFPIKTERVSLDGQNKGQILVSYLENYQEFNGLWYPCKGSMAIDGQVFQILHTEKVFFNQTYPDTTFRMPGKD